MIIEKDSVTSIQLCINWNNNTLLSLEYVQKSTIYTVSMYTTTAKISFCKSESIIAYTAKNGRKQYKHPSHNVFIEITESDITLQMFFTGSDERYPKGSSVTNFTMVLYKYTLQSDVTTETQEMMSSYIT